VNHQVGIPGIVCNGVVVPQTNQRLPEGSHVEIRMQPGDVPEGLKSEIEDWDKASDDSWKWIESLEANEP
jgi:predicted DNA-binding antitoxin AbrB/MazE fold protein